MSDGSDTLVFFALKEEQKPFLRLLPAASRATVRLCGMGRENARRATLSALQELSPRRILTCGFCGGLNPEFESGAVCFESPSERLSQALSATGLRPARFLFHDRIAVTREEKRLLRQSTQADLVEMESGIIHQLCAERGVECATVRVVSDTADEDLPLDFNRLARPDQTLDPVKLAGAILRRPQRIPSLIRLGGTTSRAAQKLAQVLVEILSRLPPTSPLAK